MARIAGIDLPKDKRIEIGLTYIYGIGRKSAQGHPGADRHQPRHPREGSDRGRGSRSFVRPSTRAIPWKATCAARRGSGHQASDRDRLLPRHPSPPRACPSAASAARPTPAPARVPRRPLPTRRSKEGDMNMANAKTGKKVIRRRREKKNIENGPGPYPLFLQQHHGHRHRRTGQRSCPGPPPAVWASVAARSLPPSPPRPPLRRLPRPLWSMA